MTTFTKHLQRIREESRTQFEKGERFERAVKFFLEQDSVQQLRFAEVYTWREWVVAGKADTAEAPLDLSDQGIDLVAKLRHGPGFAAFQCKCYDPDATIKRPDVDALLGAAKANPDIAKQYIIHTAGDVNRNAERRLSATGTHVITRTELSDANIEWPEDLDGTPIAKEPREPMEHQKEAIRDIIDGLSVADRGKAIMACGSGKTFTALRVAENMHAGGGIVLFTVPSLALAGQAMREWSRHATMLHKYIAVNSDTSSGRATANQGTIAELEIPPTTDSGKIREFLASADPNALTVVFATYQSLSQVKEAQDAGAPAFDLAIADEAHRTTGLEANLDPDAEAMKSGFHLIHEAGAEGIQSRKRLYMTATSRVYSPNSMEAVRATGREVHSMDDEARYGRTLYELTFGEAVERKILADYDIYVLGVDESWADDQLQESTAGHGLNLSDQSRVMGLFSALHRPNHPSRPDYVPKRAIAYWNTVRRSRSFAALWLSEYANPEKSESEAVRRLGASQTSSATHLDGAMRAYARQNGIQQLADGGRTKDQCEDSGHCELLTNVRVLAEGVDVPALDAVAFMDRRTSYVDIVQAVGRVMRRDPNDPNKRGMIIIPVAIPSGQDDRAVLRQNPDFKVVFQVLNAMRSHDERLNNELNAITLNNKLPDNIHVDAAFRDLGTRTAEPVEDGVAQLTLDLQGGGVNIPLEALHARIAQACSDAPYWDNWVKDIADVFEQVNSRTEAIASRNDTIRRHLERTAKALGKAVGKAMGEDRVVQIVAQHIVVRRVLNAIFTDREFIERNRIARALERVAVTLERAGLSDEVAVLEPFYQSIERRAASITNASGRQELLKDVYQKFIKQVFPKEHKALGVIYTLNEIVEFMLRSVDALAKRHWNKGLTDKGVQILDPFTGTGTFVERLLSSGLIETNDLHRKFNHEIHANEIMLLPYYISLLNISQAYANAAQSAGVDLDNEFPLFDHLQYTDSFRATKVGNGNGKGDMLPGTDLEWEEAHGAVKEQRQLDINVIISNPPWRTSQSSATEDNPNEKYPEIDEKIRRTYSARASSTSVSQMYDHYVRALRYSSDRVGDNGIIALVTNESWYKAWSNDGIRATLAEEFSEIWIVDLGGSSKSIKIEGENVFPIRVGVTIVMLVRRAEHNGNALIKVWELNKPITKEAKLRALRDTKSITDANTRQIVPTKKHEWATISDPTWDNHIQLMAKGKDSTQDKAIMKMHTRGFVTSQDNILLNFGRERCEERGAAMVDAFNDALKEQGGRTDQPDNDDPRIKWHHDLRALLRRKPAPWTHGARSREVTLAPFVPGYAYWKPDAFSRIYQTEQIFPVESEIEQPRGLHVTDRGTTEPGCLVTTTPAELTMMGKTRAANIANPQHIEPPPLQHKDWWLE